MDVVATYGIAAAFAFAYMTALFFVAQALGDNSIVDIGWGIGFIIVAWATLLIRGDFDSPQVIITAMVTVWCRGSSCSSSRRP
jgi:steroid 5-alpha reductase family enzyme